MNKPLRPCRKSGCNVLTSDTYCEQHKKERQTMQNAYRKTAHERGYTSKWSKASKGYLLINPWCTECLKLGRYEAATETDHIIPHKGDMKLFWDKNNWQGLCHSCHSKKTAKEDGGFGR